MKVRVEQDVCIGCGLCCQLVPAVFEMNAEGKAQAVETEIAGGEEEACRDAATQCPVEAIKIE